MLLKHMQHVEHPPIYFCNIHNKQLQHTFKTTETPETYICNIGEGKPGPVDFSRQGRCRWHTSTTATSATSTRLGSAATVGDVGRGAPWPPRWGELGRRGERGRRAGVEESCPLPCNTAAPPSWISPKASGSRSCSMDLTRVYGRWGLPVGEDAGHWCSAACSRG